MLLAGTAAARPPEAERLENALLRYERIVAAGGWPSIAPGPTIEPGNDDERLELLAQRLFRSGDLDSAASSYSVYDEELLAAVRRFQARHALEQDGRVGKQTLRALNVPAARRAEQLRVNIERAREVYDRKGDDALIINVPAFRAELLRAGEVAWSMRVIVGADETETPLFEATLTHVVVNPTWTVPRKIATEELLPKIQADPGFLQRGGYDVVDGDGNTVAADSIDWLALDRNNFPYSLVQQPGPKNELGRIKFIFPNDFSVCMHDTPKKYLFASGSRAFSHGCVRVQDPVDFAAALLAPEGWTREQLDAAIESGATQTILLDEPLRVVLAYLTAEVDKDGTVYFYRDIYGRDPGG